MKRIFATNILFLVFVNLLIKPFWLFGVDRTVQNVVGVSDYGIYFAIFNFSFLFQILLDLGIQYYNNRNIAQHKDWLVKFLPNILLVKMALSIVYLLVTFGIALLLGFTSFHFHLLIFLAINQILISMILYLRSNISALHKFKTDSVLSIVDKLLMIIIVGSLLWLPLVDEFVIEYLVYGQTAAYILTFLISLSVVVYLSPPLNLKFNFPLVVSIVKNSLPYAVVIFLMALYSRVDAVMLERLLPDTGAAEAGIYAAAYRILDATNMLGFMVASLLLPIFARMTGRIRELNDLALSAYQALITIALIIAIPGFIFRQQIMDLLYVESTPYYGQVFGILILSFLAISTMYVFGSLLTANGNLRQMNRLFIICVCANILLNFILIPIFGALGAAFATLVTQAIVAGGEIWLVKNIFKFSFPNKIIIYLLGFILLSIAVPLLLNLIFGHWLWALMVSGALLALTAIQFRLIDLKSLIINKEG